MRLLRFVLMLVLCVGVHGGVNAAAAQPAEHPGAAAIDRTARDSSKIAKVSVAYCIDCVPFHFRNDQGKPDGLMIDMWRKWSEKTGIAVEFREAGWDETLRMVRDGKTDAHAGLFYNNVRALFLEYGVALAETDTHYFYHRDLTPIRNVDGLAGHTVGVLAGDFVEGHLKSRVPQSNIVAFDTYDALMKSLQDGKIRVFAADTATGLFHLQRTGLGFYYEFDPDSPLYSNWWHVAVRKDNQALIALIDAGMARVTSDERAHIEGRWIAIGETDFRLDLVAYVGGGIAFILLLVVLRNRRLSREMNVRRREDGARRAILDAVSAPILVVRESNAEILFVNNAGAAGRPPAELIGRPASEIYEDPADRVQLARAMADNGRIDAEEVRVNIAKTGFIWAQISSRRIFFDGHPAYLTTWSDITELKEAQEELARGANILETTINTVDQGIVMIDAEHRIVAANRRYAEITWMAPGYLDTKPLWVDMMREAAKLNWFGDIDTEELIRNQLAARSGATDAAIHRYTRSDGVELEFWSRALPHGGWVQSVTDITEQLHAQNTLQQAKEDAEAATEAKSEFVAVVSHEVRTPMNGVLGMARLMLDTPLSRKQQDFARTIVDSGEALLTILNDLLDISKLEAGKLELEEIDFAPGAIVKNAMDIWTARTREKGLSLTSDLADDIPPVLLGDANRLRQILLNLVSNAVKFTAQGEVAIGVSGNHGQAGMFELQIAVRDTGTGISPDTAEKLFRPYEQMDSSTARKYGGTGLGLSICRRLADLMGGSIVLDSELDRGSTFTVTVPFRISDKDAAAFAETPRQAGGTVLDIAGIGLRVLIVEDNLINLKVVENMVGNLGHQVVVAANGREAVDMLVADDRFDVILMDRHMPVMGGVEATREIRKMQGTVATIPVIGVTAAVTELEIQTCLDAGMDEVVSKPIEPADLVAALGRVALGKEQKISTRRGPVSAQAEATDLPVVDREMLVRLRDQFGDEVLAELVDDFRQLGADSIADFNRAADAADTEAMQRHAHDLKTNAATLGLTRLADLARAVEIASADERAEEAQDLAAGFETMFAEALAALDRKGETSDSAAPGDGSADDEFLTLFLAKMAHDIRNNMNVILGNTRMLQDYAPDEPPDALDAYAREIRDEGGRILDLADDILTLVQVETGRYALSPGTVDLPTALTDGIAAIAGKAAERGISIIPNTDPAPLTGAVGADPQAFDRIIRSLLTNAIRFSPDGTDVTVGVTAGDGNVAIAVTDRGDGFSVADIETARSPFARIWETDGQEGMASLHYNIADRLTTLNGGVFTLTSPPEGGTTATLVFPITG